LQGNANTSVVPGVLRAFDASDLSRELWNSAQNAARDDPGYHAKFSPPTVANGKVYLTSFSKRLNVYGLLASLVGVPSVVNLTQADATTSLTTVGLVVGTVMNAASDTVPPGEVISQAPTAGTQVTVGSAVNLVVSSGPPALVNVPDVTGATQAAATTTITTAGFVVGTVTTDSSTTVAAGRIISQAPVGSTLTVQGSAIALVVSSGAPSSGPLVDKTLFADGSGARTTAAFSTSVAGELLVAFVASDGPSSGTQSVSVTGAGLTWSLVTRVNTQHGTAEIWKATAAGLLSNVTVTSTPVVSGFAQSLTVVSVSAAGGIGAVAGASAVSGAPTISLTTTQAGSLVYGVGNDWDNAIGRTVGANQTIVHQSLPAAGDTLWVQSRTDFLSAGIVGQLNDTAPTTDRWNFAAVEIVRGGSPTLVTVPSVVGTTQAAATTTLTGAGFAVGTITTASSSTVAAGLVISQNPVSGAQVAFGSAVALVVSSGPPPVSVPSVVGLTQAAASTAITTAGLVVGAVTMASSGTVAAGLVISQNPVSGAQVAAGSAVALVVSSGPPPPGPVVDKTIFSDGSGARTTAAFSTAAPGELLVAFVASSGPKTGAQATTVSGAGLSWTLVRRANTRAGTSEIWKATAVAQLSNVTVTSTPTLSGYDQSLTVVTFTGASGIGASAAANGANSAPSVSLTTTKAGALVYGVGNDWDRAVARTLGPSQTMVHQVVDSVAGATFWVQARTGPISLAGTSVQLNDTAPTNDRWNFASVEIVP
jgi:beta-lactam-binding protein with PASTA domain